MDIVRAPSKFCRFHQNQTFTATECLLAGKEAPAKARKMVMCKP